MMTTLLGILLVILAGLGTGTGMWPMKRMKRLQFEHYWFVAVLGLVVISWTIVFIRIPHPFAAYAQVGWEQLTLNIHHFAICAIS